MEGTSEEGLEHSKGAGGKAKVVADRSSPPESESQQWVASGSQAERG